jgi:hypothetical protein
VIAVCIVADTPSCKSGIELPILLHVANVAIDQFYVTAQLLDINE